MKLKKKIARLLSFTVDLSSAVRISLDRVLKPEIEKLKGCVLDVGSGDKSPYYDMLRGENIDSYITLDMDPKTKPDIVSPIEKMKVPKNSCDNVVSTEVLEHTCDPQKAVKEIHRILKPDGKCILTTRFMYPFHKNPYDYFRFSREGLEHLFKDFSKVKITPQGNRLIFWWESINCNFYTRVFLNPLNWLVGLFDFKDEKFAMGYVVVAKK